MTVLLLKLAAPLQSWGVASRFTRRDTQHYPSKSGVLGLIAAAQGRRRTDPIEEALTGLEFGVRIDQPGTLIRDFQIAVSLDERTRYPLSQRYYLSDAVFVAAVHGDRNLLHGIRDALIRPVFPLYLGRRSCPVTEPVVLGDLREGSLREVLHDTTTWQASLRYRRQQPAVVHLPIHRDHRVGNNTGGTDGTDDIDDVLTERTRDVPISFDPIRREYGWRTVLTEHARADNPDGHTGIHDPFAALGGA
ncbi:type I-E CRISPR-associated protein Cas5/CasD [Nocardia wallacei]|uniref:type I-E CRISPR-associated protein Cas5/CasD n=1 Tax=Nocardia wallacei TaxID=480035 RepID=UPI002455BB41|nr:type I-E CRISPR-associated protein Cas5/CasD [Nocardia wallacei]